MKSTLKMLAMTAAVAGMGYLTSCGNNKDDVTPGSGPKLELVASAGYLSSPTAEWAAGDEAKAIIRGTGSGARFIRTRVNIYQDGGATPIFSNTVNLTGRDRNPGLDTISGVIIPVAANSWKAVITVTDSLNRMDSITLNPSLTHIISRGVLMTAPTADFTQARSFLQASVAKVWTASELGFPAVPSAANQANVDLVYSVGATAGSGFLAPDNYFTDITNYPICSWTTKNATEIKAAQASFSVTAPTNAAGLTAAFNAATASPANASQNNGCNSRLNSRIFNLGTASGTVNKVAFKTAAGKHGVIEITSESSIGGSTRTGQVEYILKVQR